MVARDRPLMSAPRAHGQGVCVTGRREVKYLRERLPYMYVNQTSELVAPKRGLRLSLCSSSFLALGVVC